MFLVENVLWVIAYMISVGLSWLMFRTAIMADRKPHTHPLVGLAILTFVPGANLFVSFAGMLFYKIPKVSGRKFFRIK